MRSQGFGDEELPEQPEDDEDGLSEVQAASVGGRSVLGRVRRVHAGVAVGPRDRQGLERLARYLCRPPLAKARLSR
ncbi:MAG: transposase, partial [Myxococcales bacterium]|nr:transposase [Myxococcales bacterium]